MELSRVLITGGAGLVGSHIADALVLDALEFGVADLVPAMRPEGLPQRGRPEQTADMVGPERRPLGYG